METFVEKMEHREVNLYQQQGLLSTSIFLIDLLATI